VPRVLATLRQNHLPERLIIDASHGNSSRDYPRQPLVVQAIAEQLACGERGIVGVMLESFLVDGRQDLTSHTQLEYGQSVTDACIGWDTTQSTLDALAVAVRARRTAR
jgi:3-deoxy-7-phosphoheptulonate synthase